LKRGKSSDRLAQFLYILMRDYLPSGAVEGIMEKYVERALWPDQTRKAVFSNGYLAEHAKDLAARLRPALPEPSARRARPSGRSSCAS
jgi:hypothetical protein